MVFLTALEVAEASLDLADGLRMIVNSHGLLHLRSSGDVPELKVYVKRAGDAIAGVLLAATLTHVALTVGYRSRRPAQV